MIFNTWEMGDLALSEVRNRSTHINLYYNSTKKIVGVVEQVPVASKYKSELLCLLTNTLRAIKLGAEYLEVSRDKKVFESNKMNISFSRMVALQDQLEALGYIDIYKGGILEWSSMRSTNSYLKLNKALTDLFKGANINEILSEKELILQDSIVIKDRASKNRKPTSGVSGVKELRDGIDALNSKLINSTFAVGDKLIISPQYFRSFNDNLEYGGRYYEKGGKIQTQSQVIRKTLMIDNQETTELDFKALHPSMLYESQYLTDSSFIDNWIKDKWNSVYDPYPSSLSCLGVDESKLEYMRKYNPKYNPVRAIAKYALMVSLNASTSTQAQKAIILEYNRELRAIKDGKKDIKDASYYGIVHSKEFPGSKVMNEVQDYNTPIAHYFYSDLGVKLQNLDSRIMQVVLDKIMALDMEVGLSMHDGIIVKSKINDKVKKYMKEAYKEVMGSDKFCFVEEK